MTLYLIAFILIMFGILYLLHISPVNMLSSAFKSMPKHRKNMREKINNSLHPKKAHGVHAIIQESRIILQSTNQSNRFSSICLASIVLMVVGILIASLLNNIILMPVLAVGFALIPFLYILLSAFGYHRRLNRELETSLSLITMQYIQSENIVKAVKDNIEYFHSPVKEIFQKFLAQVTLINSNVNQELMNIRDSINNDVWREWIDAVISCQSNRNLKSTLMPIVDKFSDMRIVSGEVNLELYGPFKEFVFTALFLLLEPVFLWTQNKDWYSILMNTLAGKIILAADAIIFFICLVRVIKLTRPLEYQR